MNFSHVFGLCFVNFSTFYHRRCKDTLMLVLMYSYLCSHWPDSRMATEA
jgi:hypothetical protein